MRLSCALLIAAATATLLTSGKASAADSVRKSDISTMASPDAVVTIGTAQDISGEKRFLRYHNNELRGDEIEDEDEERGLFDASRLKALTREANGLSYEQLKGTGVKRYFKTLTKKYNPANVPIPMEYPTQNSIMPNKSDAAATNNRANQLNPNNSAYYDSRGSSDRSTKAAIDNRSVQLNPNNSTYKSGRKT
ncbi:hypothetical protein JG688_00011079 [Phytophthora aleatoria]|uniref:RxLR effector protein n=1 Tax=Phytophthora aleatoria TaxID=2496075 RepID=A0A8J5MF81_9STRA|nr:hypothetical protein JG688_00011079 [Phytophthora aleatoria]